MHTTTEPIAVAMGKGKNGKCEVVDQGSFASLTSCCSCVQSTVAGHSSNDVMTPVALRFYHSIKLVISPISRLATV